MGTVLISGMFMSLFLMILVVRKKNRIRSDVYLACIFAVYALAIAGAYIETFNIRNNFPYPGLMNIGWLFLLLYGPFLWFYIQSVSNHRFRFKAMYLLHFTPFALFSTLQYFTFFNLPSAERIHIVQSEQFTQLEAYYASVIAIGISTLGYNIWALILLHRHRRNIERQFSSTEHIDLNWLKGLTWASLIVFSLNVLLFNLNNVFRFAGYYELSQIAYLFASFYVVYLGYFGIRQGKVFIDNPALLIEPLADEHKSGTNTMDGESARLVEALTRLMEQQQPYLDPELNLARLSSMANLRPEILSEVINNTLHQNFFDYINKHRIEEFKMMCLRTDKKHLSIMGLAYECGFNSKAAFYRAFGKFEGTTPTAYISKSQEK